MKYMFYIIVVICLAMIMLVYYSNNRRNEAKKSETLAYDLQKEKEELAKIAELRKEKQRQELVAREAETSRQQLIATIKPFVQEFKENGYMQTLKEHSEIISGLLGNEGITLQDFLQHNVNRMFPDGRKYKIGLVYHVNEQEYSLTPEVVDCLQQYFVAFLELCSEIKSHEIEINKTKLHKLLLENM